MRHIRSAIAAGLLAIGSAAVVSAQNPTAPAAAGAHRGQMGPGKRAARALFRGIKLSDAEKANVKAVHAKYAPQFKAIRSQLAGQTPIAPGDTAARRARRAQNQPQREQIRQLMQAERADLRAALTPENQAKFDANAKRIQARLAKRAGKMKAGRPANGQ